MDDLLGMAGMAAASMMMVKMIKRQKRDAPLIQESEPITTNTISPEEKEERSRAPRAYNRRIIKKIRKLKP